MEAAEKIRLWMKAVIRDTPISAAAWARAAGLNPSTVQRAIKDDYAFVTSSRTLAKLANSIGIAPPAIEELTDVVGQKRQVTYLPIRHEVGGGLWRSVDDVQDFYGEGPVLSDPAFAGFDQWLERVVTDSMDRDYSVGTLVHVVDAIGIGYAPRTGDHVVVERRQDSGLRERTVKEVIVTPRGVELWPRSHNPKWSQPVSYGEGQDPDHCTVEIVGLVLGSYKSRKV